MKTLFFLFPAFSLPFSAISPPSFFCSPRATPSSSFSGTNTHTRLFFLSRHVFFSPLSLPYESPEHRPPPFSPPSRTYVDIKIFEHNSLRLWLFSLIFQFWSV